MIFAIFLDLIISRYQGTRIRDQGSGNREQESGYRDQGSGYRDQGTGIRQQETVNCEMKTENWELGTVKWKLKTGNWELGTRTWELELLGGWGGGWAMIGLLTEQVISGQTRGLKINNIRRGGGAIKIGQKGNVLPHKVPYIQKL